MPCGAGAENRILDFHSDITLKTDGSVAVQETIRVRFDGSTQGVTRSFWTRYEGPNGEGYLVDIRGESIKRDGDDDGAGGSSSVVGMTMRAGRGGANLPPGEYTYTLTYTASRPIHFALDRDELYWNVTGNHWDMPIDAASVRVRLPEKLHSDQVQPEGYVGRRRSVTHECVFEVEGPGVVSFATTRGLAPHESLAVRVGFPKSVLGGISPVLRRWYEFRCVAGPYVPWLGLLLVFVYYVSVWIRVGRDPAKGAISMREQPPDGLSPAALRSVWRMEFDTKTFAAALLNMASAGRLKIQDQHGVFRLVRVSSSASKLAREEAEVQRALFEKGGTVELDKHSEVLDKARAACKKTLQLQAEKVYFFSNTRWFIPGVVLSLAAVVATVISSPCTDPAVLFLAFWLSGWTLGVSMIVMMLIAQWEYFRAGKRSALLGCLFGPVVFSPWLGAEVFVTGMLLYMLPPILVVEILAISLVGAIFHHLLRAPTRLGRKTMDEIEGFRLYLGQKGNAAMLSPNEASKEFEQYFAHAVALGKEDAWAERFAAALAGPDDKHLWPRWYEGDHWHSGDVAGFSRRMADIFPDVIWACRCPEFGKKKK